MRANEFTTEEIALKFKTIALTEMQLKKYLTKLCNIYDIGNCSLSGMSSLTLFNRIDESEYIEYNEIKPLVDVIPNLSTVTEIKIGAFLSVLALEIRFTYQQIIILDDFEPKEITKIQKFANGEINYIRFADGTRYPKITPATYSGRPVVHAMYFNTENECATALNFIQLKLPSNWEITRERLTEMKSSEFIKEGEAFPTVKTYTPEQLAEKHGVAVEVINRQVDKGTRAEMEHTTDVNKAREIALDHILEMPDYYDRLEKMENE